ncbi:MAG: hypothetical protein P8J79_06080 [Halioglobus sp.]|nr:hypothetical protein [Halioglobus sp.]
MFALLLRHQRAKRYSSFIIFAAMALLCACGGNSNSDESNANVPPAFCSEQPIDQPSVACSLRIDTPADYAAAVANFQTTPEHCISPDLYVTSLQGGERLYPEPYQYAWANGSTNAHRYLEINKRWGQSRNPSTLIKMLTAIDTFIGFPIYVRPYVADNSVASLILAAYTLPDEISVQVPAFESWFKILETELDVFVPLELGRLMVDPYTAIANQEDVVEVFSKITGCVGSGTYPNRDWPSTENPASCSPEVQMALGFTVQLGTGEQVPACKVGSQGCPISSKQCFQGFNDSYLAPNLANKLDYSVLVGPLRAALAFCQDANPFNTGVGLGFNTSANPFACAPWSEQSVGDRYTGREFIAKNIKLTDLPQLEILAFPALQEDDICGESGRVVPVFYPPQEKAIYTCTFMPENQSVFDFLTQGYGFWD